MRVTGAADFLALLGGAKAAKKAKAVAPGTKPVATPTAAAATGAKTETATATTEAGKTTVAVKAALKTAAEAKADGDTARLQQTSEISAAILAALGATTKDKGASEAAEAVGAAVIAAPVADESGKSKPKAPRAVARREAGDASKPNTSTRTAEPPTPAAKPVKTEAEPTAPQPQRPVEAAAPMIVSGQTDASPQPAIVPLETQISEARIPLAVREAAQSSIAAPILAIRVTTRDGVAKSIEIRLDPAELGRVDVKLETGHDGKLQAVLSAESADAFELLKKDSGALEAALREAGVDLGEGAITFALNDFGAGQSQQREAAYGGAGARREAAAEDLIAAASAETSSWRSGVLDISV